MAISEDMLRSPKIKLATPKMFCVMFPFADKMPGWSLAITTSIVTTRMIMIENVKRGKNHRPPPMDPCPKKSRESMTIKAKANAPPIVSIFLNIRVTNPITEAKPKKSMKYDQLIKNHEANIISRAERPNPKLYTPKCSFNVRIRSSPTTLVNQRGMCFINLLAFLSEGGLSDP